MKNERGEVLFSEVDDKHQTFISIAKCFEREITENCIKTKASLELSQGE